MSLCILCFAFTEHKGQEFTVLKDIYNAKKDADEIKNITSTYEEIKKQLINQIASLDGDFEKITKSVNAETKGSNCTQKLIELPTK